MVLFVSMNNTIENHKTTCVPGSGVRASWRSSTWASSSSGLITPAVDLGLPGGSFFRDSVFAERQDIRRVHAGFLRVAPEERGNGRGKEMVSALGFLAHKYNFSEMSVGIASQYSFDIFAGIFGMDKITLFGLESGGNDIAAMLRGEPKKRLGIGADEARGKLVALEIDEKDLEDRQLGFYARISLDGFDTDRLKPPIETFADGVEVNSVLVR